MYKNKPSLFLTLLIYYSFSTIYKGGQKKGQLNSQNKPYPKVTLLIYYSCFLQYIRAVKNGYGFDKYSSIIES